MRGLADKATGCRVGFALALAAVLLPPQRASAWGGGGGAARHDREREVTQVEQAWRLAELAGDTAALDRMLADDYVGVSVQGSVHTKAQQLRRIRERALTFERLDLSDVKIRVSGEVALVSGRAHIIGSSAGKTLDGRYGYTQVLRQGKDGVWTITNFEARQLSSRRPALVSITTMPDR